MRRVFVSLFLAAGLAACSRTERTPTTVSPSPTSEFVPSITTASIPTAEGENNSHENGEGHQDIDFDVDDATRAVEQVTTALENRDWDTLYTFVSSHHTSHMTNENFTASMVAQEDQLGEIVDAEILSVPELIPDASDHMMFMVEISVTYQKGDEITVNKYIDYYVLEGDGWKVEESVPNLD